MDNEEREIERIEAEERAAEAESKALISVTQLPIIEERLRSVKEAVELAVAEAKSMIATEDTVQAVKDKRAELRKQFDALETQRKEVKKQIMAPYDRFNAVYEECVGKPFKDADAALKATVDDFEGQLKAECREKLQDYFDELCALEKINFLTLDRAMAIGKVKISLADCKKKLPRKLQDAIAAVTSKIADDLDRIGRMPDSAEISDEYKQCFDVGKAVDIVNGRKLRVQAEQEAAERRKAEQERQNEAVAKVEAAMPIPTETAHVEAPAAQQTQARVWPEFTFTVYNCTRAQLIGIRDYLRQEGIRYS